MCVVVTPAMSAATAETAVSSSYQPRSIGSRDSANAATACGDERLGPRRALRRPPAAMRLASAINAGSNSWRSARNRSTRPRSSGEKKRVSAVASIDVNTRNGLRASSSASIGRNAVDTTGTGGVASRRS